MEMPWNLFHKRFFPATVTDNPYGSVKVRPENCYSPFREGIDGFTGRQVKTVAIAGTDEGTVWRDRREKSVR